MRQTKVPMAAPVHGAVWPVDLSGAVSRLRVGAQNVATQGAYAFGSARSQNRRTVGVTLWGYEGARILAPLAATFVAAPRWTSDTWIVYLATNDYFIGLGGVKRTWFERGEQIQIGDEITKLTLTASSWPRLHFSMYTRPAGYTGGDFMKHVQAGEFVWRSEPSPLLLDPTEFLQAIVKEQP